MDKVELPFKGDITIHDLERRFYYEDAQMSLEDFLY